jgi:hypothetical protein
MGHIWVSRNAAARMSKEEARRDAMMAVLKVLNTLGVDLPTDFEPMPPVLLTHELAWANYEAGGFLYG